MLAHSLSLSLSLPLSPKDQHLKKPNMSCLSIVRGKEEKTIQLKMGERMKETFHPRGCRWQISTGKDFPHYPLGTKHFCNKLSLHHYYYDENKK